MFTMVKLPRFYCQHPDCVEWARWTVLGDDGVAEGQFCKRHARQLVHRLEAGRRRQPALKGTVTA